MPVFAPQAECKSLSDEFSESMSFQYRIAEETGLIKCKIQLSHTDELLESPTKLRGYFRR